MNRQLWPDFAEVGAESIDCLTSMARLEGFAAPTRFGARSVGVRLYGRISMHKFLIAIIEQCDGHAAVGDRAQNEAHLPPNRRADLFG